MKSNIPKSGDSSLRGNGVESVERALKILSCFRDGDGPLPLVELAARTGYHKSTVLRLCVSLERAGFLFRLPDKSFVLGSQLMRLGTLFQGMFRLEQHVRPVLKRLQHETGESASFYRREGNSRLCLFREDSRRMLRDHIREGDLLPLDKGAAAHALTEFSSKSVDRKGRDKENLLFVSVGERDPDIAAIATPIFGSQARLEGALSLSGPVTRFTAEKVKQMSRLLIHEGEELTRVLGGS